MTEGHAEQLPQSPAEEFAEGAEDEWFILSPQLLAERDDIRAAVQTLEGDPRHKVSEEGLRWLHQAHYERACITRLLFRGGHLAGFYALASAEVQITRGKELERLGILGGARV